MKSILNILKMDFRLIMRDKIALFTAIAPALLAFAFLAVIGNATSGGEIFAVMDDVPEAWVQRLETFGTVEAFNNREDLNARVLGTDNVAGILYRDQKLILLLEGNEPEDFEQKISLLAYKALSGSMPVFESRHITSDNNLIIKITGVSLLLLAIFVSGAASGFNIVSEREGRSIRALAISPMGLKKYILARSLTSFAFALVNIALCAVMMGKNQYVVQMLMVTLFCLPLLGLIAFVFGSTASNQIMAIGSLKLIMPVCLIIPVASLFIPDKLKFLFYWLPNYWQFEAFSNAWAGSMDWLASGLTFGISLAWFLMLYKGFSKKLQLK